MDSIKPCPFCGGRAKLYVAGGEAICSAFVKCTECSNGSSDFYNRLDCENPKQRAIEKWNKRPLLEKAIEGLKFYAERCHFNPCVNTEAVIDFGEKADDVLSQVREGVRGNGHRDIRS